MRWNNPTPVVIVLQPVTGPDGRVGLVMAKRGIEPKKGEWALVGGFIEVGETVERAAAREFREETGLELAGQPTLWFSDVTTAGHIMLVCTVDWPISYEAYIAAKPCAVETEELGIFYRESVGKIDLAFPIHQKAARSYYFDGH